MLYRGIAARAFERAFQLADFVVVKNASLEHGLLHVDLVREIPEAKKPRNIPISSTATPHARDRGLGRESRGLKKHDPEKCVAVFRIRSCSKAPLQQISAETKTPRETGAFFVASLESLQTLHPRHRLRRLNGRRGLGRLCRVGGREGAAGATSAGLTCTAADC